MAANNPNIPQSIDAERAVLGSVLIDPDAIAQIELSVSAPDFYLRKHRLIFEAMQAVAARGDPIDYLTVTVELESREQLEAAGGEAYLTELLGEVPSAYNVRSYARTVRDRAVRRRILDDLSRTSREAYDLDLPLADLIEHWHSRVLALTGDLPAQRLRSLDSVLATVYDDLLAAAEDAEKTPVFSTGYPDLDRLLGGLRRGSLNLVGARTGDGKTALLLNIATKAARAGKTVLFFSLEMSAESLAERLLVTEAGVSLVRLSSKRPKDDDWPALSEAFGALSEASIWVNDTPSIAMPDLAAQVRRFAMEHPLHVVFVDYLQLARLGRRVDKRYLEVGLVAQELKRLARAADLPIVAAAQLSRGVNQRTDKRPELHDLRESGNLEQDADAVMLIHRLDESDTPLKATDLILAKNRFGPTGTVPLLWDGAKVSFVEPIPQAVMR